MKKLLPLLALLAFAAGCLGTTSNNFFFSYDVDRLEAAPATPIPLEVTNVGGIVTISAGTNTPCFTDQLELVGSRSGEVITMRVLRRPQPGTCSDARTRFFEYQAVFSGLRNATYTVRVINETTGTAVTEFDQAVPVRQQ